MICAQLSLVTSAWYCYIRFWSISRWWHFFFASYKLLSILLFVLLVVKGVQPFCICSPLITSKGALLKVFLLCHAHAMHLKDEHIFYICKSHLPCTCLMLQVNVQLCMYLHVHAHSMHMKDEHNFYICKAHLPCTCLMHQVDVQLCMYLHVHHI